VFLEAARLEDDGTARFSEGWETMPVPRRPVTLVLTGTSPSEETAFAAARLIQRLKSLELGIRRRGGLPSGFHLHLTLPEPEALEPLARLTESLATELASDQPVSVTLPRPLLDSEGAHRLAQAAGALVVFLYGQRSDEPERPEAWDLEAVRRDVRRLEELGTDYLVGVVTLGRLTLQDASGRALETTTEGSIRRLLNRPTLTTPLGSALKIVDGRVYDFVAEAPVEVGSWRLSSGERLQAKLLGASHLRRLRQTLEQADLEHHLGQVYYRPPRPEEGLALTPGVLAGSLAEQPPPARIEVRRDSRREGGRLVLRLAVTNAGTESTEIARVNQNYVELRTRRGRFLRADAGDFQRYDQLDSATGRRSLRSDILRLYAPYLAAGETVRSGPVVLAGGSDEDVEIAGSFLLPDGSTATVVEVVPEEAGDDAGGDGERETAEGGTSARAVTGR